MEVWNRIYSRPYQQPRCLSSYSFVAVQYCVNPIQTCTVLLAAVDAEGGALTYRFNRIKVIKLF